MDHLLPCKGVGPVRLLVWFCTVSPSPLVKIFIGTLGQIFRLRLKKSPLHGRRAQGRTGNSQKNRRLIAARHLIKGGPPLEAPFFHNPSIKKAAIQPVLWPRLARPAVRGHTHVRVHTSIRPAAPCAAMAGLFILATFPFRGRNVILRRAKGAAQAYSGRSA